VRKELTWLALLILLAIIYFTSTYFAGAALAPAYAIHAAFIAAILAVVCYLVLFFLSIDEEGLPLGLLFLLPVVLLRPEFYGGY
jgi:hypothetical protein